MYRLVLPVLLASLLPPDVPVWAEPVNAVRHATVAHRITAVTVYADRALVTRTAHVELQPGQYELILKDLSPRLMSESIRASGHGSAKVVLHGLDVKTAFTGDTQQTRGHQLKVDQQRLRDEDRRLKDRWIVQDQQMKLLKELADPGMVGPSLTKQLGNNRAKLSDWQETFGFLQARMQTALGTMHDLEIQRRELAVRLAAIEAKIQALTSYQRQEVRQVPVNLEVERGGGFDLELTYAIAGAGWTPLHEAHLTPETDRMQWRAFGLVSQHTGEDWQNVALQLSTAKPAGAGAAPPVSDWLLTNLAQAPNDDKRDAGAGLRLGLPAKPRPNLAVQNQTNLFPRQERLGDTLVSEPVTEAAPLMQAETVDQGTSVTLNIPQPVSIPSDGQPHQTPLGQFESASQSRYLVVPRQDPAAYLDVAMVNPASWPLLMGAVRTYVGSTFVGTTPLRSLVAPGETLRLGMGLDEAVKVRRERLKRQIHESGLLGRQRQWDYEFRITVTNGKGAPQKITVVEPLPRAESDEIRVTVQSAKPAAAKPTKSSEENRLTWHLTVPAHGREEIVWGYRVEFPREMPVGGLE